MFTRTLTRRGWWVLALALTALPAMAGDDVILSGIDTWRTTDDGSSFVDFALEPIPAGFFCSGSAPFAGRIGWRGLPVVTHPEKILGVADTVVHRLDDAVFDAQDVATTRLRFGALSLVSREAIETSCGAFEVRATLAGEQPVTEMRIVREGKAGGYFLAPLELHVRLTFTPVRPRGGESLELFREISFPASRIGWSSKRPPAVRGLGLDARKVRRHHPPEGFVLVDTDGDREADTFLPGGSNFFPTRQQETDKIATCEGPSGEICHSINNTCHCVD